MLHIWQDSVMWNMKRRLLIILTLLSMLTASACSKQSAEDIEIKVNNLGTDTTKAGNPNKVVDNYISPMKDAAVSHKGMQYELNDVINYAGEYDITVKSVEYGKEYICRDSEAAEYFKKGPGLLCAYKSSYQSLVFVEINVKNITDKDVDCTIGDAYIGNLYNKSDFIYLAECAAIYPTTYEGTTHERYDRLGAGEEKEYTLCFKVLDRVRYGYEADGTSTYGLENAYIALCITKATTKEHAPLVRLGIEDNTIVN